MSDERCGPLTERLLDLTVERRRGTPVVSAAGEIDLSTAPRLARVLGEQAGPVVLDLTGVEFLSAAGVQVLLDVRGRGRDLRVVLPRSCLAHRVLELTGVEEAVARYDTVADAVGS